MQITTADTDVASLPDLLITRVQRSATAPAYRQHDGERWVDITWGEVAHEVGRWQEALRREGLKPGDRVAVCMRNRVEWVYFDQAAIGLGLVVVPLFYNDRPDNMAWCLTDAGARVLFLEDGASWAALAPQTPTLERVLCLRNAPAGDAKVRTVADWLPTGDYPLARVPRPHDLATLVYTSGTTGRPKGVMLTHDNIVSNVFASLDAVPIVNSSDRFLSFLPLSHMFERTAGYYLSLCIGAQTVYARGIPELAEDMLTQKPTVLICVPRIFERVYAKMQEQLHPGSLKRRLFERAVDIGWKRFNHRASLGENLVWPLLDLLVARKLHRKLGGRIRLVISGAAAFAPELSRVFMGLGLPILQGYGLTEFSPVIAANRLDDHDPTSVGRPIKGVEVKVTPEGELCARGPGRMQGYWNNKVATDAVIDTEGWLHTGDLVEIRNGRIHITGRAKEIIVLTNGEKVPPSDAEQAILMDTAFEQAMVIGEGRSALGLVVVTKLTDEREICERANRQLREFPGYTRIRYVLRTGEPWTIDNGMLTPTLKLKRHVVEKRYHEQIEAMYARRPICGNGNGAL